MKKWLLLLVMMASLPAMAARQRAYGFCEYGAQTVLNNGIKSTTKVQKTFLNNSAGCTVTIYFSGTITPATIFSNNSGTVLANPFTASASTGYWFFYADDGRYDAVISGTDNTVVPPASFSFTYADILLNTSTGGGGGGGGPTLETNGALNGLQSLLNLKAGTNVGLSDDGIGGITISSTGGGGGGPVLQTNGVGNGSQALLNLKNGTVTNWSGSSVTVTDDGVGGVTVGAVIPAGVIVAPGSTQSSKPTSATAAWQWSAPSGAAGNFPWFQWLQSDQVTQMGAWLAGGVFQFGVASSVTGSVTAAQFNTALSGTATSGGLNGTDVQPLVCWPKHGGGGDDCLSKNTSDQLLYNNVVVASGPQVTNCSGTVCHVDGTTGFTTADSLVAALCATKHNFEIYDDIADTFNTDLFNVCSNETLILHLTTQPTPYILNAAQHIGPRSFMGGRSTSNTVSSIGTWVQKGPSFPAGLPTPTTAPSLTGTGGAPTVTLIDTSVSGSCPGGNLGVGAYFLQYSIANVTGPTARSPVSAVFTITNGTQCLSIASPTAIGNALAWEVAITLPGGDVNSTSYYSSAAMGTTIAIPTGSVQPSFAIGDPLSGYNGSSFMIGLARGAKTNGAWLEAKSGPEINNRAENMLLDCNGLKGGLTAGWDGITAGINWKAQEQSAFKGIATENCGSDGVFQNAAIVIEGLNGGRGANNSKVDIGQQLDAHISTCGAALNLPCNPILGSVFVDQVKSFRGIEDTSTFYTQGVSTRGYVCTGPLGFNAAAANVACHITQAHLEGKNSDMVYGYEVLNEPATFVHDNISSTSGGTAGIHLGTGSGHSVLVGVQSGPQRAMQIDVGPLPSFLTPNGADQSIGLFAIGDDTNHIISAESYFPRGYWTGDFTSNAAIPVYSAVKIATGVDDKVVKTALTETSRGIGVALQATTVGTDPLDIMLEGRMYGAVSDNNCASGNYMVASAVTAGQFHCNANRTANKSFGYATAASTAGNPTKMLVRVEQALGYQHCDLNFGADNGAGLVNADVGPQRSRCIVPADSTVVEINVDGDAGTPAGTPEREHGGTNTDLLSGALATGAVGVTACSNAAGTLSINGTTTCTNTLTVTALSQGDRLGTSATGAAASTAKAFHVHIIYTLN